MAEGDDRVSVKHRKCWETLFKGLFTRFILFSVAVNQGSTLELRTTLGVPRGAKAAADAGSKVMGMVAAYQDRWGRRWFMQSKNNQVYEKE